MWQCFPVNKMVYVRQNIGPNQQGEKKFLENMFPLNRKTDNINENI